MTTLSAADLVSALGVHPIVAQVLLARGCHTPEAARGFLDPAFYTPTPPQALPDMDRAAARLGRAIATGERIRIWGDFDVDGQTATSVLLIGLRALGANVDFTIPDRITHSHGLNAEGVARAAAEGVALLLTCDCGIAEFDEVAQANALGIDVIISDHHDLHLDAHGMPQLPAATAIVNPKRLPPEHPLSQLPGVGVAFKIIETLNTEFGRAEQSDALLDLVALGIVADVAIQRGDTRYLLQRGLQTLRKAERPGVRELMRISGIDPQQFDADSIGYQIGPRLNAAGRLSTATLAVSLLTTTDPEQARALAAEIDDLNVARREQQKRIEAEALALIDANPAIAEEPILVLHHPGWSASVIGIVASTLVDRYQRPAILIAEQFEGSGRASARSIAGIDIHAAIAAQHQLIEGGGGHPMAAGFAIRRENIEPFIAAINGWMRASPVAGAEDARATGDAPAQSFLVSWHEAALPLAEQLAQLAPFGAGNPYPLLHSDGLKLIRYEPLGKKEDTKHRALYLDDGRGTIGRALWWRSAAIAMPDSETPLRARYKLRREIFRERARATIEIAALEPLHETPDTPAEALHSGAYTVIDLRTNTDSGRAVQSIIASVGGNNVLTWHTHPLRPCQVLILNDAPAGPELFKALLAQCKPHTVVLIPVSAQTAPSTDDTASIQQRVLGMLKVAESKGDALDDAAVLERMAMRINQRVEAIRACIALYRGEPGAAAQLAFVIDETVGYRRFVRSAPSGEILPRAPSTSR